MPTTRHYPTKPPAPPSLYELDRVKLLHKVTAKARTLQPGLTGPVVYCGGNEAYEVEFLDIKGFFKSRWEVLLF
jgi:hypothetical protein